jgi:ATP-binding cassette subfamily B protein
MISISPIMTLIAFIAIPLTVLVSTVLTKAMRKYYVKQQRLLGALNGHIEEMVTGYNTVVAYGKEDDEREKFAQISEELRRTGIKAKVWGGIMGPCMNIIGNLQYLLVAGFGGYFALAGGVFAINIGDIQKMLQYSKKFTRPINELANQFTAILTALAGAERIFEIFDGGDEIDEGKSGLRAKDIVGNIEFSNIDFSYKEGEQVLRKFNLSVKPGQKIAIVGATGSGKTTVVNLLTRFYEIDGGSIKIDGVDIRDISKKDLREAIGIVLQDTVLFSDTIRQNIMYGNFEADEESMKKAASMARADEFIERLPEGYDTQLTEAGRNLSQGQRQLLSISRAILKDPKILILDEATSSVDTRTEMNIQSAMVALMKNRTSLIIAHRLSTIRDADVIVVISKGAVVEAGNHEELLALGGEYHKLYSSQFAGVAI